MFLQRVQDKKPIPQNEHLPWLLVEETGAPLWRALCSLA